MKLAKFFNFCRSPKSKMKQTDSDVPSEVSPEGLSLDTNLPLVTVGIRFHDASKVDLIKRCILGIAAQSNVRVHIHLTLQGFSKGEEALMNEVLLSYLDGSGFNFEVDNVPNENNADLRSMLLNRIIARHYERGDSCYLCFIDFDDIWFQHALSTLLEPLELGNFALSYADVHCANVYFDDGQTYIRDIKDIFRTSQKTKRDLLHENFLPLHSYMFHTDRISREVLHYDETLERLEDYDVLLGVARDYPISGLHRKRLIGLYNFYETADGDLNTTQSVFRTDTPDHTAQKWQKAQRRIIARHSGKRWHEFWGEEWTS